MTSLMYYLDFW